MTCAIETERERDKGVYIYIYTVEREREREHKRERERERQRECARVYTCTRRAPAIPAIRKYNTHGITHSVRRLAWFLTE